MARFMMSPGVMTREVDNSQYTATVPAGSVAALVGYAEKGPFEPKMVRGQQEFIETFGKTLEDAPYLAQAAYKYLEQADQLLVVRAGDNRDPESSPQAARFASKTIRISPSDQSASAGYQKLAAASAVAGGTYAPGATYRFRTLLDHRGFDSPKYMETWPVLVSDHSGTVSLDNVVIKIAMNDSSSNTFKMNYKSVNQFGTTAEYFGEGTRAAGTTLGSVVNATLRVYRQNENYENNNNDYVTFNGTYGAVAVGSLNVLAGVEFTGQSFFINTVEITPTPDVYLNAADIVTEINEKLDAAGLETEFVAFVIAPVDPLIPTTTKAHIGIRQIGGTATQMTIAQGTNDALVLLGIAPEVYNSSELIYGSWNSSSGIPGEVFSGSFVGKLSSSVSNSESFEDMITVSVTAPSANDWPLSDIVSQIEAELDLAYNGTRTDGSNFWGQPLAYSYTVARGAATLGDDGRVTLSAMQESGPQGRSIVRITGPTGGNNLVSLLGGTQAPSDGDPASSVGEALMILQAAEKGSYGNKLVFRVEKETIRLTASSVEDRYNIYVLLDGKEVSVYRRLLEADWTDPSRDTFVPKIFINDPFIKVEAEDENGNSTMAVLPSGSWQLGTGNLPEGVTASDAEIVDFTWGTNGWTQDTAGSITSMSADYVNALQKIYNSEIYDFNLIAAPGDASPIVQNAVQSLCDSRRDCFGIVDAAEFGIGLGIEMGTNHVSEVNDSCSTLNSSYVGAYWPWLQDYDADNQQYVWLPPSIYALKQIVYTDAVSDPWFAPAGTRRGKVTAIDVEYSPSKLDRDILYGDTAIVNPIVKFVNEGIVIWGQKTAQRSKSALDRINVRRLLIYAEKLIARMARGFLFEPNDEANWSAFARQANAILEPIRQRRGLTTYKVVCDATTNTPALINQNIMAGKIFVQPTKTIEFIEVEFTINPAGDVEVNE